MATAHFIGAMFVFLGGVVYMWLQTLISYRIYHASLTRHHGSVVIALRLLIALLSTIFLVVGKWLVSAWIVLENNYESHNLQLLRLLFVSCKKSPPMNIGISSNELIYYYQLWLLLFPFSCIHWCHCWTVSASWWECWWWFVILEAKRWSELELLYGLRG